MEGKLIVGCLECCRLPELGISNLHIRVDTGAKTSSLHVDNLSKFKKNGKPWVEFDIHPDSYNVDAIVRCQSPLHDARKIKSSNGITELRYVINTPISLGGLTWQIEITLTNRADMSYLMLLGREGMSDRLLVDPSQTFLISSDEINLA